MDRLAREGFEVEAFGPEADPDELAGPAEADVPYGLIIVLEEDLPSPAGWTGAWHDVVAGRVRSAYAQTRALSRLMMRARTGRIVFVVSADGMRGGVRNEALTVASGVVAGMARAVARELAGRSVLVNTVAYGASDGTDCPIGRGILPSEVAGAVAHLFTDSGAAMCGQVVSVDGGLVMR
jgi:3-oxoacyl-[acyl-carrier protein] reductase